MIFLDITGKKWKGNPKWVYIFVNYATHIRPTSKLQQPKFHWKNNEKIKLLCGGYMSLRCEWIWNAEVGTWASLCVYMKRVFMSKMSIQIRIWNKFLQSENEIIQENFLTNTSQSKLFFRFLAPRKVLYFDGEDSMITEDTWAASSANVNTGGFRCRVLKSLEMK